MSRWNRDQVRDAIDLGCSETRSFKMLATANSYLAYSLLLAFYRTNSLALSWFSCVKIPASCHLSKVSSAVVKTFRDL